MITREQAREATDYELRRQEKIAQFLQQNVQGTEAFIQWLLDLMIKLEVLEDQVSDLIYDQQRQREED